MDVGPAPKFPTVHSTTGEEEGYTNPFGPDHAAIRTNFRNSRGEYGEAQGYTSTFGPDASRGTTPINSSATGGDVDSDSLGDTMYVNVPRQNSYSGDREHPRVEPVDRHASFPTQHETDEDNFGSGPATSRADIPIEHNTREEVEGYTSPLRQKHPASSTDVSTKHHTYGEAEGYTSTFGPDGSRGITPINSSATGGDVDSDWSEDTLYANVPRRNGYSGDRELPHVEQDDRHASLPMQHSAETDREKFGSGPAASCGDIPIEHSTNPLRQDHPASTTGISTKHRTYGEAEGYTSTFGPDQSRGEFPANKDCTSKERDSELTDVGYVNIPNRCSSSDDEEYSYVNSFTRHVKDPTQRSATSEDAAAGKTAAGCVNKAEPSATGEEEGYTNPFGPDAGRAWVQLGKKSL